MTQIVTRISDELATEVDRLIEQGVIESRSDAVRRGLYSLVDAYRRAETGRAIVAGYERTPPDPELAGWAQASAEALIEAESW